MSDDDMIRRGDAIREISKHAHGSVLLGGQTYRSLTLETATEAIAALPAIPAADARAEALLKRAAQMAYEVWDDPEALAKAILALIPETKP